MTSLSLKLDDKILEDTNEILQSLKQSRNAYINAAIAHYNALNRRAQIAAQLAKESSLVKASSMEILGEMETLENDYEY
jgi:predicted transcriptional regulator